MKWRQTSPPSKSQFSSMRFSTTSLTSRGSGCDENKTAFYNHAFSTSLCRNADVYAAFKAKEFDNAPSTHKAEKLDRLTKISQTGDSLNHSQHHYTLSIRHQTTNVLFHPSDMLPSRGDDYNSITRFYTASIGL
ncbi:hypothetical protein MRB53_041242 [Persea americana]|nr:hypothetical protein MRB53_041242 [Persea americana]